MSVLDELSPMELPEGNHVTVEISEEGEGQEDNTILVSFYAAGRGTRFADREPPFAILEYFHLGRSARVILGPLYDPEDLGGPGRRHCWAYCQLSPMEGLPQSGEPRFDGQKLSADLTRAMPLLCAATKA